MKKLNVTVADKDTKKERKKMKKKSKDIAESFWLKWEKLDYLERLKHIEKMYILIQNMMDAKLPKKHKKEMLIQLLNSYFEDLYASLRLQ